MKALPMPDVFATDREHYFECWKDILSMCQSPSKRFGIEVVLIRDRGPIKAGTKGIARPFNAVDIHRQLKDYNDEMKYKIMGLPDLSRAFDFYPYYEKDGRKAISLHHTHISQFDCKATKTTTQLEFEF
ncbi:hypothetical protein [Gaoshiqia sediminis]|uniref:Uncharacterized protein n=1 Tax=Gaoshiqia sediminis TaxID=2986998 RepID=A0AA41YA33_9BACT|nr:hypothetical protein [Gaoshiqia sediminis]MCW0484087.1 hypothetical protein [Gaoshiqia sediminis]